MKLIDTPTVNELAESEADAFARRVGAWPVPSVDHDNGQPRDTINLTQSEPEIQHEIVPKQPSVTTTKRPDLVAITTLLKELEDTELYPTEIRLLPGVAILHQHCEVVATIDGLKRGLVRE